MARRNPPANAKQLRAESCEIFNTLENDVEQYVPGAIVDRTRKSNKDIGVWSTYAPIA